MVRFDVAVRHTDPGNSNEETAASSLAPLIHDGGEAAEPLPMRRPKARVSTHAAGDGPSADPPGLPPLWVIVMNRMGFGPRPGDREAFEALGASDQTRLEAYIEQQLHPESLDDSDCDARLAAGSFGTLEKTREELWADHHVGPPGGPQPAGEDRLLPFWETERATFLRATYSRRQLAAVLADFWHNHFNVYGADFWSAPLWVHYDRDIIRPNLLGNFRKMLEDVGTSFPMMLYLDGYGNTVSGPNENYARELFELHGLGAENYLGVGRQDEVPLDSQDRPVGYVDDDVYESTRAFTGWGIDFSTGQFAYFAERHDRFQKHVLGRFLRADQAALRDGRDVLDAVAYHSGTARHISRKLCRRLIADDPPQRIVDEAAAVFLAERESPDQIRHVVRTILRSHEFRTTWGQKIKRPFEFFVSCFRAVDADLSFALYHRPSDYFMSLFAQAGQPLFQWPSPDGYADVREKWTGSNAMVGCWRMANWINGVKTWWDQDYQPFDPFAAIPPEVRSAREIADFWIERILGRPMSVAARREIVEFMARGRDPETPLQGFEDGEVRERVWGTIALIMTSPENFQR
jgi:uncharacterized protein (DUF1800 family)